MKLDLENKLNESPVLKVFKCCLLPVFIPFVQYQYLGEKATFKFGIFKIKI